MGVTAAPSLDDGTRETLVRTVLWPAWLAVAALAAAFAAGVTVPPTLQYVPLVASALVLGLPHGAVDHLAVPRVNDAPSPWRGVAAVVAVYVVLGGLYAAVWFVAPAAAFAAFVLLTLLHWGQGDVYALLALADAGHLRTAGQRTLAALVRGGLPMLVPLLAFPGWYRRVAGDFLGLFGVDAAALAWAFAPAFRTALGVGYGLLVVTALAVGYARADDRRTWALDAGETALLLGYFAVVPPVLAVGVYFCFWHSLRHIGRLLVVDDPARESLSAGRPRAAFARFARDATPLTLVSLALLAGLYALVPAPPGDLGSLVALYLVLIAVLTLPHVAVVTWMDYRQNVWVG
ncbi:beta-carotene 15,15'-monooxygenase [Halobacteriales archaeon QS_1_68_17]|nr:MAG: beta-carotene 15,15'-monooxygenase [Halobacteriales archaeon QS_1_68_17]